MICGTLSSKPQCTAISKKENVNWLALILSILIVIPIRQTINQSTENTDRLANLK